MLRMLRGGQRWLTALIVAGVGTVFVVFLGIGGGGPLGGGRGGTVVSVGPHEFGPVEFERVRQRREATIRDQLGDQYDARALRETLDNLAARELVEQGLLALAAEEMGLAVSKREIERLVLSDPGFRDEEGRFDRQRFTEWAEYEYGSQRAFMEDRRLALLSFKMLRLLNGQPEVSEGEARDALQRELTEVRIASVALYARPTDEELEIAPAEIQRVIETRPVELTELYQLRLAEYDRPERVRARHILISLPPDAPAEEVARVEAEIAAARGRLEAGESFEELARELSDDPGSQLDGGDLGFFARGQMVPPFEQAAFGLEPGELSETVRTDFGLHLIRVEEREAASKRELEEVREELAAELLRREAQSEQARARAEELAAAIRDGGSLEQAARELELDVARSGWLRRRGSGVVPGLGPAPELLAAAFALEPGESSPRVFEVGESLALVQLLERREPDAVELEAQLEARRESLLQSKRDARIDAWINARRDQLMDEGELVVNLAALQR